MNGFNYKCEYENKNLVDAPTSDKSLDVFYKKYIKEDSLDYQYCYIDDFETFNFRTSDFITSIEIVDLCKKNIDIDEFEYFSFQINQYSIKFDRNLFQESSEKYKLDIGKFLIDGRCIPICICEFSDIKMTVKHSFKDIANMRIKISGISAREKSNEFIRDCSRAQKSLSVRSVPQCIEENTMGALFLPLSPVSKILLKIVSNKNIDIECLRVKLPSDKIILIHNYELEKISSKKNKDGNIEDTYLLPYFPRKTSGKCYLADKYNDKFAITIYCDNDRDILSCTYYIFTYKFIGFHMNQIIMRS